MPSHTRARRWSCAAAIGAVLMPAVVGCTTPAAGGRPHPTTQRSAGPTNATSPNRGTQSPKPFPILSGREFDQSLRNGQPQNGFPPFGRLLAATQTGGPRTIAVDLTDIRGPVIGIFVCKGSGEGPAFSVRDGDKSVLWFRSGGCDDTNLYSGQSQPVRGGNKSAKLRVTVPNNIRYSFVLEEVSSGQKA